MTPFADLPDYLLAPFQNRSADDWARTPGGKWSPGQVVDHVATAVSNSGRAFQSRVDKPSMSRRPRSLVQVVGWQVVSRTGWFPPGRKAPETALPGAAPDRGATEAKLRSAVAAFVALRRDFPSRTEDLFVKHPVFGDLTLTEFMTFHVRHAQHHRRQIVERLGPP